MIIQHLCYPDGAVPRLYENHILNLGANILYFNGRSYISGRISERYKFTEKERDKGTELDYFGARYNNSKLGMWLSVDPLADKYPGWSPYNYCENNSLILRDPTGKGPEGVEQDKKDKALQMKIEIYKRMLELVKKNNRSKQSNELIISVIWKESSFNQSAQKVQVR